MPVHNRARTIITDKREAILQAAIRTFAGKGFFNSKVADIAKEAGVADGTVYLYFKNKDDILYSVFDRAMEEFIEECKKELALLDDPKEKLRRISELHLERLGSDHDMAIVFQVEMRGSTKFMQDFSAAGFSEYLHIIQQIITEGQKKGIFRKDLKPIIAAKILYGALDEMVTNWILSSNSYPLAPMTDEVLKVFFGGILKQQEFSAASSSSHYNITQQITTESLLNAVVRMSERDFNDFIEKANKLRSGSSTTKWTKDEVTLIQKLNGLVFSDKKQTCFDELVSKRRSEEITQDELKELIELTEESEALNIKRLKILGKLADSKNKSLREIMNILEIEPPKVI